MIEVYAVLDEEGILKSCKVSGHALAGPKGGDMVCLAVSTLVRTALRIISGKEGLKVQAEAPERGVCKMETDYTAESKDFLSAAGSFLLEGLMSVSEEYPNYCKIVIHRV